MRKAWILREIFLLANTSIEIVLEMPFLFFTNADLKFRTKKLTYKSNITAKTLLIAKSVKLIEKYKFVEAALNKNSDTFVVYVVALVVLESVMFTYLV